MMAVVRCDHPLLSTKRKLSRSDLMPHILVSIESAASGSLKQQPRLPAQRVLPVSTIESAISAVRSGLCYGWLPKYRIQSELDSGDFVALPLPAGKTREVRLNLVCKRLERKQLRSLCACGVAGIEPRTRSDLSAKSKCNSEPSCRREQPIDKIDLNKAIYLTCRILHPVCTVKKFQKRTFKPNGRNATQSSIGRRRIMHSFLKLAVAKTLSLRPAVCLLFVLALPCAASSQARIVNATIDTSKTGAPISKNIYGQFLEHGGDIVNTGVWSEMLVDRKFFYPVSTSAPKPPPVMGNAAGNPRFNRTPTRWWAPVGGDDVVTIDTKTPYTGDHTPLVKIAAKDPHGFMQSGIAVRKGKSYTGRIVLAGPAGATVKVALIWGKEATDRQTITLRTLGTAFHKFPLRYAAAADTDDATLEITGTGAGSFRVGTVSLMPADNIEGFRPEVIAALKQLRFGVLRFPGGNFVSSYEWRYGSRRHRQAPAHL
jgi:hypothetical protein